MKGKSILWPTLQAKIIKRPHPNPWTANHAVAPSGSGSVINDPDLIINDIDYN